MMQAESGEASVVQRVALELLARGDVLGDRRPLLAVPPGAPEQPAPDAVARAQPVLVARRARVRPGGPRDLLAGALDVLGVDEVQERLGHSSIAITMDIYSHLMPNMQGEAAAAVDGALRAAIKKRAEDIG